MSKKRTSAESSNDEQTNEGSDGVSRQVDNCKRGKLSSFSDTTLQDIPTEILQSILIKAITMEVKKMKLAKSVWKEKADLVISRLGSVCSQWSSVLSTDFFRIDLHRALDGIAQKIRMEILQESMVHDGYVLRTTSLKNEILMLCRHFHGLPLGHTWTIAVYDRNNVEEAKEIVALPGGLRSGCMAACNVSNCVYVLDVNWEMQCTSVSRLTRDEQQKFKIQRWISDLRFPMSSCSMYVTDVGNLIIVSRPDHLAYHVISVYNAIADLLYEIKLSPETYELTSIESNVIQRSNGNLVFALTNRELQMVLTEIDTDGIVQRQYKSSLHGPTLINFADTSGRILIHDLEHKPNYEEEIRIEQEIRIELLDSELNLLEFTRQEPDYDGYEYLESLHFNSEMNEVMANYDVGCDTSSHLKVFRFIEE